MLIAIVAGHGGSDTGAHYDGLREKVINLIVAALAVEYINTQLAPRHMAILIRDQDENMTLDARGQASKKWAADFVICIHVNAIENCAEMRGRMAFYWPGNTEGKLLAHRLTVGSLHTRPVWPVAALGWRSRAFHVIKQHTATTVLLEMGFATNAEDHTYLLSTVGQEALAQILCSAIDLF